MALENAFGELVLNETLVITNAKLDLIIAELSQKLETGGEVILSNDTIFALQSVTADISNLPNDFPDVNVLFKLEAIRLILANQTLGLTDAELRASALPISLASIPLATDAATNTTLVSILNKLITSPATETTSAAILAKLISNPNVEATQLLVKGVLDNLKTNSDTLNAKDFATQTTLASLLAKVITNPATDTLQSSGNDILTNILTKIIVAPATEAKQDTANTALATLALIDFVKEATLQSIIKQEDAPHISGDKGIPMFGIRADSDAPTVDADGDYTLIKLDEEGRVKVSSKPASFADITGSITAVQATIATPVVGGTVIGDVSRASNVMMFCTGTFSTVNVSFEGCLEPTGEAWFGLQAVRSNANTIETATGNLSAQPIYAWELSVNALARVRVRCTARTSGTQVWRFKLGTYATEPIPASQITGTQAISGTVTANQGTFATPTASNINSAATTNATIVKASAGTLYNISISNIGASTRYVKLYNKATAVTVGTDVPVLTITVPANSTISTNLGATGHRFTTGISLAITGAAVDSDTTVIGAGEVKVLTSYI